MTLSSEEEIRQTGYGITGYIGGQPLQTYWTPDGRQIKAIPSKREWQRKGKDGKVVESGVRDANLDKGWLFTKPEKLKLYCPHCDYWHDTQKEIKDCEAKRKANLRKFTLKLKQHDDSRVNKLEIEISELKDMFKKFMQKSEK